MYTTEERYTIKRSYYSNKISTSNSAVHPSQYLTITVDAEEKRQLEENMKVSSRERKLKAQSKTVYSTFMFYKAVCCFSRELNCLSRRCNQACESKLREIDERMKALQKEAAALDRRDNELLAEKKHLSELKGKKRQLEQKITTKQDR